MNEDVDSMSFEATGNGALDTAITLLERFAGNGQFNRVRIEIGTHSKEEPKRFEQTNLSMDKVEDKNKNQEPQNIRANTSHHRMLSALKELEHKSPVATKETLDIVDMPDGTAYAAMSSLHERGLVDRTSEKNDDNSYEYTINEAGKREIERLGTTN